MTLKKDIKTLKGNEKKLKDWETIYENISVKELREIMKKNRGKYTLGKMAWYDGWRYALLTKKGEYRVNIQKGAGQYDITY